MPTSVVWMSVIELMARQLLHCPHMSLSIQFFLSFFLSCTEKKCVGVVLLGVYSGLGSFEV